MNQPVETVLKLFRQRGGSQYGGEAVTQLEHALQAAMLAEREGADEPLVAAALLHDVGHLLHSLPDDSPDQNVDDRHEELAGRWLARHFAAGVVEPVRLHVEAKRYLCAVDPAYLQQLSGPSIQSLHLQGGPMTTEEVTRFEASSHFEASVRLRRWDEAAKVVDMPTPDLAHFAGLLERVALKESLASSKEAS